MGPAAAAAATAGAIAGVAGVAEVIHSSVFHFCCRPALNEDGSVSRVLVWLEDLHQLGKSSDILPPTNTPSVTLEIICGPG